MEIIIEERLASETEDFFIFDRYKDGKKLPDGSFMRLKNPIWFVDEPRRVLKNHCGVDLKQESVDRLDILFDNEFPDKVNLYHYMCDVCLSGHTEEVLKWLFGPIAAQVGKTGGKVTVICPSHILRIFVEYLAGGKFPRHFANEIFNILLDRKPSSDEIIKTMDQIIVEPRFAISSDSLVDTVVATVITANPEKAEEAKTNRKLIQWFVGQTLKANKALNPATVKEILEKMLA